MGWIFSLLILFTPQEVEELIKNSPPSTEYRGKKNLVLIDRKTVKIHKNRSMEVSRLFVIKIFNPKTKHIEIKEEYDNEKEEFQVLTAFIHTPSGNKIRIKESHITDSPKILGISEYKNKRLIVASFPSLSLNSVIEYEYKISPKKKSLITQLFDKEKRHFFLETLFGGSDSILKKEVKLIIPKWIEFKYMTINGEIVPLIKEEKNNTIYIWKREKIPPVILEPHMPPIGEIVPRLILSSFTSWDELREWFGNKFYKNMKINKKIKEEIWKMMEGKREEEIIKEFFLYTVLQIKNIPLGVIGYTPQGIEKVYTTKYGTPLDKAILLCTFLKEADIPAMPVFINTNGIRIVKEVPSPTQFNHVIVAIKIVGGHFLMDPLAIDSKFSYLPEEAQGVDGFIVFRKGWAFRSTLRLPKEVNLSTSKLSLSITEQGDLSGSIYTKLSGIYDRRARQRLKNMTNKEKKEWVLQMLKNIAPNAKLIFHSISDLNDLVMPVEIRVYFEIPKFASLVKNEIQLFLPNNPFSFAILSSYISLTKRVQDLIIGVPRIVQYHAELKVPEDFIVNYLPQNWKQDTEFIEMSINTIKEKGKIIYKKEINLKKQKITPLEYPEFRKQINNFLDLKNRLIKLKKK